MQRIAIALCALSLFTTGTGAATNDDSKRGGHEIVQTQVSTGGVVTDRVARLAVHAAFPTSQTPDLTRDEKIALLLFVSAARQNSPAAEQH